MSIAVLGKRRRYPYSVKPGYTFEQAKNINDGGDAYSYLGKYIMDKYLSTVGSINTSVNFMGFDIPVVAGKKADDIKKQTRIYPKVFGTTKQKLYDVSTEMRPTSNDFANAWNAGTGLAGSIKNVVGYDAPPAYSVLINKDQMWKVLCENPRFCRSMQWYLMSGRKFLNVKLVLNLHLQKGRNIVLVDYPQISDPGQNTNQVDFNDRIIAATVGDLPTYLDNPNFIKDASRIEHEDFQSNIVVDASAIAEYETELNRIKAAAKQKLVDSRSETLQQEYLNIKIGYAAFLNSITIFADNPMLKLSFTIKITYENSQFEPYMTYLYKTIVPIQVVGTHQMLEDGQFKQAFKQKVQSQQLTALKSSTKKLSKLAYYMSNSDYVQRIMQDPAYQWEQILLDWQNIDDENVGNGAVLNDAAFYKYRKYNQGLLKTYQGLYVADPKKYVDVLKTITSGFTDAKYTLIFKSSAINKVGIQRAVENLALAYNQMQQKGASDIVTRALLTALVDGFRLQDVPPLRQPRQDNQGRNYGGGGGGGPGYPGGGSGGGGGQPNQQQPQFPIARNPNQMDENEEMKEGDDQALEDEMQDVIDQMAATSDENQRQQLMLQYQTILNVKKRKTKKRDTKSVMKQLPQAKIVSQSRQQQSKASQQVVQSLTQSLNNPGAAKKTFIGDSIQ